jgi:uncharacterized protein YkwD
VCAAAGLTLIGCQQGTDVAGPRSSGLAIPAFDRLASTAPVDDAIGNADPTTTAAAPSTTAPAPEPVPAELVAPWQPPSTTTSTTTTAPPPPPTEAPAPRKVRVASAPASTDAPAPPPAAPPIDTAGARTLTSLTNDVRASAGLAALGRDGSLDAMAADWAQELASSGNLRHSSIPKSIVGRPWSTAGENVGFGPSVPVVHDALVASPGHYANITGAAFTRLGVGVAVDGAGQVWVVEVFAG